MITIHGPGWGNYAIQGIVETQAPAAISMFPATPGWWVLALTIAVLLARAAWRRWQRYRAERYRREALDTLHNLRSRYEGGDTSALRELAGLLRSTALAAGGNRRVISALRGEPWSAYLQGLAPSLPPPRIAALERLAYAPDIENEQSDHHPLFAELEAWIARHEYQHA